MPKGGEDMSGKPIMLDLYCGAGGAAKGYVDAGWDVVGVDINAQPDYPYEFHEADAIEFVLKHGGEFQARHASPPCQASSTLTTGTNQGRSYPQLIPETRAALGAVGGPYVIENVLGAPIRRDILLCGEMFDLAVIRHRVFELGGWSGEQPEHKSHRGRVRGWRHGNYYDGPYLAVYGSGGGKGSVAQWQDAMGIHWTSNRKSIAEAIPPAYTECIGRQLLGHIN